MYRELGQLNLEPPSKPSACLLIIADRMSFMVPTPSILSVGATRRAPHQCWALCYVLRLG